MPGLNGTGPEGKGSLTGRRLGNCPDADTNPSPRRGMGLGRRGCGRGLFQRNRAQGRGRGIWNLGSSNDEVQNLKKKISELEARLEEDNK